MIETKLHHTQFDMLRRCYEQHLLVQELVSRAGKAPLTDTEKVSLYKARATLANHKSSLRLLRNRMITLDDVNEALESLCSMSYERAHALIDRWEYKARQR